VGKCERTARLAKAEPLYPRALAILIGCAQQDFQDPNLEAGLMNDILLLQDLGLSESEIQARLAGLLPSS
jgi:hypothetical protein